MTTEPSEAAKAKADALWEQGDREYLRPTETFARFIQEVSDAAKAAQSALDKRLAAFDELTPFILPDPLEEVTRGMIGPWTPDALRERLAKHGLKIVEQSA